MKHLNKLLFFAILFLSFKSYSQCAVATTAITNVTCNGMCDGTAQAIATGVTPYTFSINNGAMIDSTTGLASNLCAGTYVISVTDGGGCIANTSVLISQPPTLISTITNITNPTTIGTTGYISIISSGGSGNYFYSIAPNNGVLQNFNGQFSNLLAGCYTITTTDANSCSNSTLVCLTNVNITLAMGSTATCIPGCDGTDTLTTYGGVAPYSYSISPNTATVNGNIVTGLCLNTSYLVTATDATGSTNTVLLSPYLLMNPFYINNTIQPFCNACNGEIVLTSSSSYTYTINPSAGNVNGNVISGICSNVNYTITATDAGGCTTTSTAYYISSNNGFFTPTISTGPGTVTASAPSQPSPILYSLNGAPFSSTNSFNGLCTGGYTLQVQDGNGCVATSYPSVVSDTAFPGVIMNTIITDANCQNSLDGSADFIFVPTSTHYFCPFGWSNCGITTSYHGGLAPATYGLDIIDSATNYCVTKIWTINSLGTNCGDIDGTVYLDSNSNCINDANDMLLNNIPIQLSTGQFTFTNPAGNYSFNGLAYNNYTVSQSNSWWWNNFLTNSCGNNFNVTLNSTIPTIIQNFADTSTAVLNNSILVSASFYVPGITSSFNVIHYGTSPAISSNGIITLVLDPNLVYQNAFPTPNYVSLTGDTLKWNYSNFTTFESYQVNVSTDTTALLGMSIQNCVYDNVTSGIDAYLPDNTSCTNGVVWTSYDPNNKVVSPAGIGSNGGVLKQDSVLSYTINFQNTGTYLAHKVVLMDTLSDKVDLQKFRVISFSHPYEIEVIDNHILKFIFNQIMLPDSNSNEPASHGHISYQILQKNTNQLGDVIKNKASIYFDYNAPIVTNETVNTIVAPTSIVNTTKDNNAFSIYPSPASTMIYIRCQLPNVRKEIFNSIGQLLITTKENKIDISQFPNGIYLIKVANGKAQRFVIQK